MPNYLEFCGHSADSRAGLVAEPPCCEMFAAEAGSSAIVVGAVQEGHAELFLVVSLLALKVHLYSVAPEVPLADSWTGELNVVQVSAPCWLL